jgi:hypothetical protein
MLLPDSPDFGAYALRAYIKEALRSRCSLYLLPPNSITPAKTNVWEVILYSLNQHGDGTTTIIDDFMITFWKDFWKWV